MRVIYCDKVTNLRLFPNVSFFKKRVGSFSILSVVGRFESMNSLKPVSGTGAETCHFQATFNYLLIKDVGTKELKL